MSAITSNARYRITVPLPSVSVMYRSTATFANVSVRPLGHLTRTVTGAADIAKPDEHARIVRRRVAAVRARPTPQRAATLRDDLDSRANHVTGRLQVARRAVAASQCFSWPANRSPSQCCRRRLIDQQSRRSVVVADQQIDVAVVVHVPERRAAPDFRRARTPSRLALVTSSNRPLPAFRSSSFF